MAIAKWTVAIRAAIASENWHSALALALAMPDICGGLEYPNEGSSRMRYERWFESNLASINTRTIQGRTVVFLSGNDCYALRCAYLHGGIGDITEQKAKKALEKFFFTTQNVHRIQINKSLTLNIASFCEEICVAVEKWADTVSNDAAIQSRMAHLLQIHDQLFSPMAGVQIGKSKQEP